MKSLWDLEEISVAGEERTNRCRRMTNTIGVVHPAQASEGPSFTHSHAGPPAASRGAASHSRPHLVAAPVCRAATHPAEARTSPVAPIWMAALLASSCQVVAESEERSLRWDCVSGRALYTNRSQETEFIQPLGVRLEGGDTLAVWWQPGETAYTWEIFNQSNTYYFA